MKRNVMKWLGLSILLTALVFLAIPKGVAQAGGIPPTPHAFYGDLLTTGGGAAQPGVVVRAKVNGEWAGDPLTTTAVGKYGGSGLVDPKLIVQDDILDGTAIEFYVQGVKATPDDSGKAKFYSGRVTELGLTYTPPAAPPAGVGGAGGGGGAPPPPPPPAPTPTPTLDVNVEGVVSTYLITSEGKVLETVEESCEAGCLIVTVPEGTITLDKEGNPLGSMAISVDESPPPPPEDANILGLPYTFEPGGATFDPPMTLSWCYDPADIPEGVAEEDLVIAYYDEEAGKWVVLKCVVDTENNIITASLSHWSTFARIVRLAPPPPPPAPAPAAPAAFSVSKLSIHPAEVKPGETVTITVSVANTGGTEGTYAVVLMIKGVKEAEKGVTLAAGKSKDVTFSVTKKEAGTYSVAVERLSGSFAVTVIAPPKIVPPAKPAINWPLLGAIIAATVILVLVVIFAATRRRRGY